MKKSFFYGKEEFRSQLFKDVGNEISVPYIVIAIQEAMKMNTLSLPNTGLYYTTGKLSNIGIGLKRSLATLSVKDKKRVLDYIIKLKAKPYVASFIKSNKINLTTFKFTNEKLVEYIKGNINSNINRFIREIIPLVPIVQLDKNGKPIPPAPSTNPNKVLYISLSSVKCDNLTNWEPGDDEIDISFITTDDNRNTVRCNTCHVGNFSQNNQTVSYGPSVIHSFNLDTNYNLPKVFTCTALLAEIDYGGFASFIDKVWDLVNTQVYTAIFDALAANATLIAAAQTAGCAAALTPLIVVVVAAIIALVAVFIIGLIIEALKDDVFDPYTFVEGLIGPDSLLDNGNMIKIVNHVFEKHGGKYTVTLEMKLAK